MLVGTILLTKSNKYVDDLGNLPKRPKHDKELLTGMLQYKSVSEKGYKLLPSSMQEICYIANPAKIPITIRELNLADLLIVSRSLEDFDDGKEFRLTNFRCLVKDRKIEIWVRNK